MIYYEKFLMVLANCMMFCENRQWPACYHSGARYLVHQYSAAWIRGNCGDWCLELDDPVRTVWSECSIDQLPYYLLGFLRYAIYSFRGLLCITSFSLAGIVKTM